MSSTIATKQSTRKPDAADLSTEAFSPIPVSGTTAQPAVETIEAAAVTGTDAPVEASEAAILVHKATHVVYAASLWAAAAAIVPVPFLDLAAIAAVQVKMLRDLSALYDQPIKPEVARGVVSVALGVLLPSQFAGLAASAAKSIPVLGTIVGTVSLSGLAGAATYAIGKVFVEHLESGGTIGNFSVDHTKTALQREFRAARLNRAFSKKAAA